MRALFQDIGKLALRRERHARLSRIGARRRLTLDGLANANAATEPTVCLSSADRGIAPI